jgi:hypothetical protein
MPNSALTGGFNFHMCAQFSPSRLELRKLLLAPEYCRTPGKMRRGESQIGQRQREIIRRGITARAKKRTSTASFSSRTMRGLLERAEKAGTRPKRNSPRKPLHDNAQASPVPAGPALPPSHQPPQSPSLFCHFASSPKPPPSSILSLLRVPGENHSCSQERDFSEPGACTQPLS